MDYISTPLSFHRSGSCVSIERSINERIAMMDNLVELIVFTPRGNFNADPDFGLEYWNHEYANMSDTQFNNNIGRDDYSKLSIKEQCEANIAESIKAYAPDKLKIRDIYVSMNMKDNESNLYRRKSSYSHHEVVIFISAKLDDGMGTTCDYAREVSFMVEPTVKKISI